MGWSAEANSGFGGGLAHVSGKSRNLRILRQQKVTKKWRWTAEKANPRPRAGPRRSYAESFGRAFPARSRHPFRRAPDGGRDGPRGKAKSGGNVIRVRDNRRSVPQLNRIAWLVTVGICLVSALILLLSGYDGYAGVTLAVAIAAAINLF